MKKKKILLDLSILKHPYCGLGQVALNYGRYFKEHYVAKNEDYEIYLLLPKNMFGKFGSEVKYLSSNNLRRHIAWFLPKMDVWHAIHQQAPFKPFSSHTKFVLTIHDFNFMYEKSKTKKHERYLQQVQKKVDRADKIVCISEFTKKETEKYIDLKGKAVDVIYNGIENLYEKPSVKPDFIKNDRPFFFTLGQVKRKKNFHVLLPLMKLFPEKELYICGRDTGDYAKKIKAIIEEEKLHNVHLTGIINDEERVWMYANCNAFLFPSLFEGFGLPILEAMSFGKPVFSSPATSLEEIGRGHAFFWPDFEPQTMKKVIDDNLGRFYNSVDMSVENINYARSFSYENHLQKYIHIYLTI